MKVTQIVQEATERAKSFSESTPSVDDVKVFGDQVFSAKAMVDNGAEDGFVMKDAYKTSGDERLKCLDNEEASEEERLKACNYLMDELTSVKALCFDAQERQKAAAAEKEEAERQKAAAEAAASGQNQGGGEVEPTGEQTRTKSGKKPWGSLDISASVVNSQRAKRNRQIAERNKDFHESSLVDPIGQADNFQWGSLKDGEVK